MLEVAEKDHGRKTNQSKDRPAASAELRLARAYFFAHQTQQRRRHQAQEQHHQDHRIDDVNYVPRVPARIKRRERAHTVIVGEVQKDVDDCAQQRVHEQQAPSRRHPGPPAASPHQPVNSIHAGDGDGGDHRRAQKAVRETAMMLKTCD